QVRWPDLRASGPTRPRAAPSALPASPPAASAQAGAWCRAVAAAARGAYGVTSAVLNVHGTLMASGGRDQQPSLARSHGRTTNRYCHDVVRDMCLPSPFSVQALCDQLAERRGRGIHIHLLSLGSGEGIPCGTWLATDEADHIFVEEGTSAFHRDHIVLHELG